MVIGFHWLARVDDFGSSGERVYARLYLEAKFVLVSNPEVVLN